MSKMSMIEQIEMLRVQLETAIPPPFLLVVSSARAEDGKGVVASGLARSMEAAGYSTLLVLADEATCGVSGAPEPRSLDDVSDVGIERYLIRASRASVMLLPSAAIRHSVSRESVARFGKTCKKSYQVTIVEAAAVLTNSFAMLTTIAADGVLLAIRRGRRVCPEDGLLAKTLAREQAPFLGVVAVAASLISNERFRPARQRALEAEVATASAGFGTARKQEAV